MFAPFSTETQYAVALERMGHTVKRVHQDPVDDGRLVRECSEAELVILVGGHGRNSTAFEILRKRGIPSCTMHLDKFVGIPGREPLNGWHWETDRQFTADFDITLPTHEFMRPSIAEEYCHYGVPREDWKCDVAFVGARDGYHNEYPFRQRLADWAEARYGDRFTWIGGECKLYGHDLNDFYASTKVVVGDWYGGGKFAQYTSDRLPETVGRGGTMVIPKTIGVARSGSLVYEPGDLMSVQDRIEWCLDPKNAEEIRFMRDAGMLVTKLNHTHKHRLERVIKWSKS